MTFLSVVLVTTMAAGPSAPAAMDRVLDAFAVRRVQDPAGMRVAYRTVP